LKGILKGISHILRALEQYPNNYEFLKLIFSKCNTFDIPCNGVYSIHYAGLHCKPDIIKLMVDMNVNLENKTDKNKKLIHILCARDDCDDLIKYLIEVKKVSVEDYDHVGLKPIHYTFLFGSFEIIEYLKGVTKDHKMNMELANIKDKNGIKYESNVDLLTGNPNVKNMIKAMFEID